MFVIFIQLLVFVTSIDSVSICFRTFFLEMMIIKCAKIVLARDAKIFVLVYVPLLAILSFAFNYIEVPQTYFSAANNFLNVHVFKPAFNFTVVALLIYVLVTLTSQQLRYLPNLLIPYTRLLVSWLLYSIVKQLIEMLAVMYGKCEGHPEYNNQQLTCTLQGYTWSNFRISGHAFYLLYAMLLILEEAKAYDRWELKFRTWKTVVYADSMIHHRVHHESSSDCLDPVAAYHRKALGLYEGKALVTKTVYTLLAVWMVLLHFNMLCTIVYFHAPIQKVEGALMAVGLWFITYGAVFKLDADVDDSCSDIEQPFYLISGTSTSSLSSEERLQLSFDKDTRRDHVEKNFQSGNKVIYKYSG